MIHEQPTLNVPVNGKKTKLKPTSALLSPEEEEKKLLLEYDWLTDGLLQGLLTTAEKKRVRRVEARLDELDAATPAAAAMRQKQDDVKQQLNALLEQARQLPSA